MHTTTIIRPRAIGDDAFGQLVHVDADPSREQLNRAVAGFLAGYSGQTMTLATDGKARFNELVERLHPITPTTLTRQLRELERDGLVKRTQYNEIPPRVEYEATELSATLRPVPDTIAEWVHTHAIQRGKATEPAGIEVSQPA